MGILIVCAILLIIAILYVYLFFVCFVRSDLSEIDNLDSKKNRRFKEYRKSAQKGQDFIKNQKNERVYIKSFDGLRLSARYYSCENSDKCVILVHGYRSSASRDFLCAVEKYYNTGFNVLLIDGRAHGESEGKLITLGIKERRDVLSWVNFIKERKNSKMQIILHGFSMGATAVLLSAGLLLPENVKGIVADSGFSSPADILKKLAKQRLHTGGRFSVYILNILCLISGGFSLYGTSTAEALKHNRIPVLLIHSKDDNFVPAEMSTKAYEATAGEKEILLTEGAGHGLSYFKEPERIENTIKNFIGKYI